MAKNLFRQEVIDAKRGDWLGSILIAAPLSRWWVTALACTLAAALLLFLFFGQYTRRESVTGQLVPSAALLTVTAITAGTVTQLHVVDGQAVHAGDVLIEISSEQDSATLGDTHALVGHQLDDQQRRLHDDLLTQRQVSDQQAQALRDKITLLHTQSGELGAQLAIQQRQADKEFVA